MIAPHIVKILSDDAALNAYCGDRIFTDNAPIGTAAPYIVVSAQDSMTEEGVVAVFDIEVNIYDYNEDKRASYTASRRVVDLLNFEYSFTTESDCPYERLRIVFSGRHVEQESDTTLSLINITFNARATIKLL